MAIENLTTYTEVSGAGALTVTSAGVAFTDLLRTDVAYVYKDFGASYFAEFDIDFEFEITDSSDNTSITFLCGVSNTIGTYNDWNAANDGISVYVYGNYDYLRLSIIDNNTDNVTHYGFGGTSSPLIYCTFSRVGTIAWLIFYSNSARTSVIGSVNITCETGNKQYLYVLASRESGSADAMSGYTQNFEIIFASSSSSSTSLSSSSLSSSSESSSSTSSSSSSLSSSSLSSSSSSSSLSSSSSSSSSSLSSSSSSSSLSSSSSSSSTSSSSLSSSSSTSLVIPSLKHFWYRLSDNQGVARGGEEVSVYKAETTELLSLYDQVGLSASNPVITSTGPASADLGVFEFYLKDEMWNNESPLGYEWEQRIKTVWEHDGGTREADRIMTWGDYYPTYEEPFAPSAWGQLTEPTGSDADDKNKSISNSLGYKIECHIETDLWDAISS